MKKTTKVMHIRDSSGIFGAERVILTLANNINKSKIHICLICLRRKNGRSQHLIDTALGLGIDVFPVDVCGRFDVKALYKIRTILGSNGVDIIHTHDFKSDFYGLLATIGTTITRVATAHGSTRDSLRKKIYLLFTEKGTYRFFHKVIAVSRDLKGYLLLRGLPTGKIEIIQNGMDFSLLDGSGNCQEGPLPDLVGKLVFSIVGRLFPDKGHRYFLEAFNNVHRIYPQTAAMVVGDGPERSAISEQIHRLKLEGCVYFCGVRKDMGAVYDQTNCIVIPSLTEGLPYVLLEAMAKQVPIIASAVGDIPLLIKHGGSGYLVKPGDVKDLEKKMFSFVRNPSQCKQMASKAYTIVTQKYSARNMAAKTESLYRQLTESKKWSSL